MPTRGEWTRGKVAASLPMNRSGVQYILATRCLILVERCGIFRWPEQSQYDEKQNVVKRERAQEDKGETREKRETNIGGRRNDRIP